MLASVTVLFGSTVRLVHPAGPRSNRVTAAAMDLRLSGFMCSSLFERSMAARSEPERNAGREGARARIDVVVDSDEPRGRVDAAVPGDGERVLHRAEDTNRLVAILERVPQRDVVHAEERRVLHVVVGEELLRLEAGLDRKGTRLNS